MKNISKFFLLISLCFLCIHTQSIYKKTPILQDWKVKIYNCPKLSAATNQQFFLDTSIPTNTHLDLLYNKKIQDPFFGKNWEKYKWISDCNAIYSKSLIITQDMFKYQVINLVFEGIDTYSTIKINSKQVLKTQNAFVQYKINIRNLVEVGQNFLEVSIQSPKLIDQRGQAANRMPFPYAQTRKPCYQYSWDWAPYMISHGIWKQAYLQFYNQLAIDFVWIQLKELTQNQAILSVAVKLKMKDNTKKFDNYKLSVQYKVQQLTEINVNGEQNYMLIKIDKPKLWWPNGIGTPYIYDFEINLIYESQTIDHKWIPFGIRTVKLNQTNRAFTVQLNGYKIYCKGSNYVPPDMLYPRLLNKKYSSTIGNTYQKILKDAVASNFNMIRVWGGGQYQTNQFYEMASRMGIMIFHDFMFSDSIYPSTKDFLNNVKVQIVQQIRRIRNYPALVLWSGNNQILQGIQSWGWGTEKYRNDYKLLFEQHIAQIVKIQSPQIPYIASSPVNGVGNGGFAKGGDFHYWGVWAGGQNFQNYQNAIGPFNSQFGTQGLPVWQTILSFTSNDKQARQYSSNQLLSHERHGSQFQTLKKYMGAYAKKSLNFELQTYQSGLVQALALEIAFRAQRSAKINNKSMGTLYWQLNDAWPAISWSSIDYYGRWKPLQYKAKTYYKNVVAFYDNNSGQVVAINDNLYNIHCFLETKIIKFNGQIYKTFNKTFSLRQNQAKYVLQMGKQQRQIVKQQASNLLIQTKLFVGDGDNSTIVGFFKPYKDLDLPKCQLYARFDNLFNFILLQSKCLIKSLHIYHSSKYLALSDNYIDIVPGQIYKVSFLEQNLSQIQKEIKFRSYVQVYDPQELKVIRIN